MILCWDAEIEPISRFPKKSLARTVTFCRLSCLLYGLIRNYYTEELNMNTCKLVLLLSLSLLATTAQAQWVRTAGPARTGIASLLVVEPLEQGTTVYAGTSDSSLFRTTDNGASWLQKNIGLPPIDTTVQRSGAVPALGVMGNDLYAGTMEFGIYHSTNRGDTWSAANAGFGSPEVFSITACSTTLLACHDGLGIFRSTDKGASWMADDSGLLPSHGVLSLAVNGSIIYAGTLDAGLFRSTDDGISWINVSKSISWPSVPWLITSGSVIYMSSYGGLMFRSTDSGGTWTNLNDKALAAGRTMKFSRIIVRDTKLFAATTIVDDTGGSQNGVSMSNDSGNTWVDVSKGLPFNPSVWAFAVSSKYLFAGLGDNYVWRRPLTEFASVTDDNANRSSKAFSESYPNPFTIKSTISFSLPHAEHVSLKIFDILGHEIATLADQDFDVGPHEAQWVAGDAIPGVYYCRVATADGVQSRSLVLTK